MSTGPRYWPGTEIELGLRLNPADRVQMLEYLLREMARRATTLRTEKDEAKRWAARYVARVQNAEAAANRLLMEKDQWHDSARVAEAELARQRPVVDAAEALVEHRAEGSWKVTTREADVWDKRHGYLLAALAEKVREAQRDG